MPHSILLIWDLSHLGSIPSFSRVPFHLSHSGFIPSFLFGLHSSILLIWVPFHSFPLRSNGLSDNSTENYSSDSTYQKIAIYSGITAAVIIFNVARIITVSYVAINASRVHHNRALRSLLRAPILFFDTNTLGVWGHAHDDVVFIRHVSSQDPF